MKNKILFFCFILLSVPCISQTNIRTWDIYEVNLSASQGREQPYIAYLQEGMPAYITAEFKGIEGPAKGRIIAVPGFWDGDVNWKVRFTPPLPGKWTYVTSSEDRSLNNKKGELNVEAWNEAELAGNPIRRGFIVVNQGDIRPGRYFTYSDGTPCLWIADTWWNWTDPKVKIESFKRLVDTRADQGYNIGQMFIAAKAREKESSILNELFDNPNLEQIRKVEEMIKYANSKGITIWIGAWWSEEEMNNTVGEENMIRWWRYLIHRLHAYNVIWVVGNEYNMYDYGGLSLAFWNRLGEIVKSEDPYKRIVSTHPTPPMWRGGADAPQWSTAEVIHNEKWMDYNQSQVGHGRWRNEMIPWVVSEAYGKNPAKPIVVTEPWYEFIEGCPSAMDIRFGAWSAVMSGAAGHSYGGGHIWRAYLPERPTGIGIWPMDTLFATNTMLYKGAVSIGFMGKFLRSVNWWQFEPHPEYVIENPSPYCLAISGEEYLFYLRYGGSVRVDLTSATSDNRFSCEWIDLVNDTTIIREEVYGGKIVGISCPEDYPMHENFKDWILHLKKL